MKCPMCQMIVAVVDEDIEEKLVTHQLYCHPTRKDMDDCYQDLLDAVLTTTTAWKDSDYINVDFWTTDLVDFALRLKKYANMYIEGTYE